MGGLSLVLGGLSLVPAPHSAPYSGTLFSIRLFSASIPNKTIMEG